MSSIDADSSAGAPPGPDASAEPAAPAGAPGPAGPPGTGRGISRKESIALFLHRGLDRWLSPLGVWVYRRTKGGITRPWKVDALLLATRGRRSGKERTVVLQFFPDGDAMIVAAANDGGTTHPGWYFNLKAEPTARVEVMGRAIAVRAEELPANEATAWWQRILRRDPSYERYARAAGGRTIPVLRLVPISTLG
jgi:deazaflavin-dependent oxidoreductase (nitroreductase family)